jgi:hypothetical protein
LIVAARPSANKKALLIAGLESLIATLQTYDDPNDLMAMQQETARKLAGAR